MSTTQGYLSKLQFGDQPTAALSNNWTDIAQILDIKPPKIEAKDVDTTTLSSDNQTETFAPGWANGGEATVKVQFNKTQQATLFGMFRKALGYRIVFNDATTQDAVGSNLPFDGYIKSIQNEIATKELVTCDLIIKVSGLPTFNAAA